MLRGCLTTVLALCVFVAGCGEGAPVFTSDELTCDIADRSCQETIWRSVAELLEARAVEIPPVRVISLEEYAEELDALYEPDTVEASPTTVAFRLMGFIRDDDTTITDDWIDNRLTNTAAYYSTNTESITIIDREYEPSQVNVLLAHEFTHAIQDQQFDLDAFWEGSGTEDDFIASRSVVEGDATRLEWDWFYRVEGAPLTPDDWQYVHDDRRSWLKEWARDPQTRFSAAVSVFPYVYGLKFMADAYVADGPPTRRAIFTSPPLTTASIVKGYAAFANASVPPAWPSMVSHPAPVPGYDVFAEEPLGMWYVYVFLGRLGMSESDAWGAASELRSDSFGVYAGLADATAVWRLSFASDAHVGTVEQAVAQASSPGEWQPVVHDNDLFIIAAETRDALAQWASQPLDSDMTVAIKSSSRRRLAPIWTGTCIRPH